MIRGGLRLAVLIVRRTFSLDRTSSMAASISFFAILSFLPFMLLAASVLGHVLASSETALKDVLAFIAQNFPGAAAASLETFKNTSHSETVYGFIAALGLLWAGSKVFDVTEYAMNKIWRCRRGRTFWASKLIAFVCIPTMMIFVLVSILLTSIMRAVQHGQIPFLQMSIIEVPVIGAVISFLAPVLISTLLFTWIFYLLPNRWGHLRSSFYGALLAALLWEAAKLLFDYYVRNFEQAFTVYGSFTSAILLFLWVYYSAFVFLIGAEFGSLLQAVRERQLRIEAEKETSG
ncbi:MAG: YihY/virulence factor BrkB family protein [bacterium]|nr:YihY/virulence factor BrkB family protein [bacterium]